MPFFLDHATARSAIYLLQKRSELISALKSYKALAENELPHRMKNIRLDRAGEHVSNEVNRFVNECGITLEFSPAYASQSNGSSERLIQEIWKVGRTMLFEAKLDIRLWAEAISHANWLRNRLPAQRVGLRIPYTLWTQKRPDMSAVLHFGQSGYAFQYRSVTVKGKKILPRTVFGNFVGMESENTLYRVFIPTTKSIYICRKNDFKILEKDTELPSFSTQMENISRKQQLAEMKSTEDPVMDTEETQSK